MLEEIWRRGKEWDGKLGGIYRGWRMALFVGNVVDVLSCRENNNIRGQSRGITEGEFTETLSLQSGAGGIRSSEVAPR